MKLPAGGNTWEQLGAKAAGIAALRTSGLTDSPLAQAQTSLGQPATQQTWAGTVEVRGRMVRTCLPVPPTLRKTVQGMRVVAPGKSAGLKPQPFASPSLVAGRPVIGAPARCLLTT